MAAEIVTAGDETELTTRSALRKCLLAAFAIVTGLKMRWRKPSVMPRLRRLTQSLHDDQRPTAQQQAKAQGKEAGAA
jgi:hypothetical protein